MTSPHIYSQQTDVIEAFKTSWKSDAGLRSHDKIEFCSKNTSGVRLVCVANIWCIIKTLLLVLTREGGKPLKTYITP